MEARFVTPAGVEIVGGAEVEAWRERTDGFVWFDFETCDDRVATVLRQDFGFHPQAVHACRERTHLPTFHGYPDYWFVVVHRPFIRLAGHVHLLQLELFIRDDLLVTLHGPYNPDVEAVEVSRDTAELRRRLDAGRLAVKSPSELGHALIASLARDHRTAVGTIAERVAELERDVMDADLRSPEHLLDRMFLIRHELVTLCTMAADTHEVFARMAGVADVPAFNDRALMADLADRFGRIRTIGDGERDFLAGVIDYYQTKTATKMTVAMERLAVLAAVTLPITALASIYGMNVIVNGETDWIHLGIVLATMLAVSGVLLRWTKRQGWW